jgi:hypothetical protein
MQEYYGELPDFRIIGSAQSEADLENIVMRLYDRGDKVFLKGAASQLQYDTWSHDLNNFANKVQWDRFTI